MALNFGGGFIQPPQQVLASFDAIDVASGRAVEVFNAGTTSGAFILSDDVFYSQDRTIRTDAVAGTSYVQLHSGAFQVEFLRTMVIDGSSLVSVSYGLAPHGDIGTSRSYINVKVQRNRGGVITELMSGASRVFLKSAGAAGGVYSETAAIDLELPKTTFGVGDKIILLVEQFGKVASNNADFGFGCDPRAREDDGGDPIVSGAHTTKLEFHVPFVVD